MKTLRQLAMAVAVLAVPALVQAGTVTVKGVHLCCGACVSGANKALVNVDGVSGSAADRDSKTVSFQAKDDAAAAAGIQALADAGFVGTATHGDKPIAFPDSGAKDGAKGDSVTLAGVHLCCGACVKDAQLAVEKVAGVTTIDIDRKERTVTLVGKDISVTDAVKALNAGGFYGKVKAK